MVQEPSEAWEPREVISSKDCSVTFGRGSAPNVAVVTVPTEDGAEFAVVDGAGTLFSDVLPFVPNHRRIGRSADGAMLVGFADLRLNSREFRAANTPEPVRIYIDGQVAYETDKAWNFGVAPDGSSFYLHEPIGGGASRLFIRNLDTREEAHFDLDLKYTPSNDYESGFGASYTTDAAEVVFFDAHPNEFGLGLHRFYSATGDVRELEVGQAEGLYAQADGSAPRIQVERSYAVLASSSRGYFAKRGERTDSDYRLWQLAGRDFQYEPSDVQVRWTRELPLRGFGGRMSLSDDSRWLILHAWNFQVLDAATGDTVFEYLTAGDKAAELSRLASVMAADARLYDVGGVVNERIVDGALVFHRQIGSTAPCTSRSAQDHKECVARLRRRGVYRSVLDVFHMDSIELHSQPDSRFEFDYDAPCKRVESGSRQLQVRGDKLVLAAVPR